MTARILPFATRVRHQCNRQRRIEQAPVLTASTDGTTLTITAQEPIPDPDGEAENRPNHLRPNFRD